jgi:Cu(I)/Ag(I) efflux system membrane protein CusA/SilA
MVNAIIRFALTHRLAVILATIFVVTYGAWIGANLPIDVFPDLNRPRVVVMSEAHGLAPEEVESIVTTPIESVLNGTPGVTEIRSSSGIGISIIYVDFEWGTDIYRARQLVAEKLQQVRTRLPKDVESVLSPITSIMGEIQFLSLNDPSNKLSQMDLRSIADWTIRPAITGIKGVSQVVVMGGQVKQYQVLLDLKKLSSRQLTMNQVRTALEGISQNTTGGVLNEPDRELLIRPLAQVRGVGDIENTVVGMQFGRPVLLKDIATVQIGGQEKRGTASVDALPSVIMTIQKQPTADTISLTKEIESTVAMLQKSLPEGATIRTDLFKQATFIEHAIGNVAEALRDGSIMVATILFFFLLNFRTTFITLTAIPVSFVVTFVIFQGIGLSINTMTLGGLAIAVGELVDDAIVDVENVFRRLRENNLAGSPKHPLRVVFDASKEIRNSLVVSTAVVIAVFVPLFAMSGLEGRFFTPMGMAYIISLLASLLVSITLTPVLCYLMLPKAKATKNVEETFVIRQTKRMAGPVVTGSINRPIIPLTISAALLAVAVLALTQLGRDFLPRFNEGTATIGVASYPGISLEASDKLGQNIEKAILSVPEVKSTVRRTGRAEMDEHAEGVHWSEIDVDFKEDLSRPLDSVLIDVREKILATSDVYVNIGQPISHRIDHMMSGIRAEIAIKIFGNDFVEMRRIAVDIETKLKAIAGLVDIQVEPLVKIPQVAVEVDRDLASQKGIVAGTLAEELESLLAGEIVSSVFDEHRKHDIVLRAPLSSRDDLSKFKNLIVGKTLLGEPIALGKVAEVYESDGPNMINRDGLRRRLVVSANTSERSLSEVVKDIKAALDREIKFPEGYYYTLGGKFEAEQSASTKMALLGCLSILASIVILYANFKSLTPALIVLVNIPLALIGSVAGIYMAGLSLSLATLVAFITLCGIASRNGLLMINHYRHLRLDHPEASVKEIIFQGTLERLIPVLMTAGTGILALLPLLLAKDAPGKEILYPVAVVIVSGLFTSTVMNTFVTPALAYVFKGRVFSASETVSEAELLS